MQIKVNVGSLKIYNNALGKFGFAMRIVRNYQNFKGHIARTRSSNHITRMTMDVVT